LGLHLGLPRLRVWDRTTHTERAVLTGHTDTVCAAAIGEVEESPVAVTGDERGTVRVWDLTTGTERAVLTGHTGGVHGLAIGATGGRPVAVTSGRDGAVRIWDLALERCTAVLSLPLPGTAVAITADTIVLGMAHEVVVLDRRTQP